MLSAILSFLGGSVFRAIWGELSTWFTARQEHRYELDRLRLQGELDAAAHGRNMEAIKVQADLGVKTIMVQADADLGRLEMEGWAGAVKEGLKPTGIALVDTWNGVIRPLAASIAIFLWVVALNAQGWKMSEWDRELVGVILGFFFASRVLTAKGKV
jgi:hypothetical protein